MAMAPRFDIQDLTLAGEVGGLNHLFYSQMRRTAAAARFHFLENGRPGQTNFQKILTKNVFCQKLFFGHFNCFQLF